MKLLKLCLPAVLVCQLIKAQTNDQTSINKTKEEIKSLLQQLNEARLKHDRSALEKIYALEFVNVHSAGFIDDRETTINEILTTDSIRALPIPILDRLMIYDNVAVLRTLSNTAANTVNANRLSGIYIYAKRDGRWQIVHAQGTPLQRERKTIRPDSLELKKYVGKYERNPGEYIIVENEAGSLVVNVAGRGIPKRKLMATSNTDFFDKLGSDYIFSKDETGKGIVLTTRLQYGQESKWRKIE